jgi:alcohol dehydrogenase (cytochrome c)
MLYLPLNEYCSNTTPTPLDPGQAYTGGGRAVYARVPIPNSDGKIGSVQAVKLSDQSKAWSYRTRAPQTGAVLPTGSGLVFSGAWDRYFRAFDDTTGVCSGRSGSTTPSTRSRLPTVNGKQYVAVSAGNGSSQARSLATLTPELQNPDGGSALWVFALPD